MIFTKRKFSGLSKTNFTDEILKKNATPDWNGGEAVAGHFLIEENCDLILLAENYAKIKRKMAGNEAKWRNRGKLGIV